MRLGAYPCVLKSGSLAAVALPPARISRAPSPSLRSQQRLSREARKSRPQGDRHFTRQQPGRDNGVAGASVVPRLPVPSRVEVASARLPSAVPRLDSRGRPAPLGAWSEAPEGAGAEIGFVSVARVKAGDAVFGGPELVLIAGPCVIESYESCIRHATRLADIARRARLPLVFKSSFDKANRTSHSSFRGPGLTRGLGILARVKREAGVPC